jgi:hypothetical protein
VQEEGKQIIYLDETWVNNKVTLRNADRVTKYVARARARTRTRTHARTRARARTHTHTHTQTNKQTNKQTYILKQAYSYACRFQKWLPGNTILIFKAGPVTGDYHGQKNSKTFEKWVTDLFPVYSKQYYFMDNALYYTVEHNKASAKFPLKSKTNLVYKETSSLFIVQCEKYNCFN